MGDGKETIEKKNYSEESKMSNTHGDPKMERICNVCGVMYSEVISKECPLCKIKKELIEGDNVVFSNWM